MIPLLRHMLQPAYLYAQNLSSGGTWRIVHTRWILALLLATLSMAYWALRRGRARRSALAPAFAALCFGGALGCQIVRFSVGGPLSARVHWLTAATLGLLALACRALAAIPWGWLRRNGRALALSPRPRYTPPAVETVVLTGAHVLLTALGLLRGETPFWLPLVAIALWLLSSWRLTPRGSRLTLRPTLLAPWFVGYGGVLLRWLVQVGLGVDTGGYGAVRYPDLWSPWFDPRITWGISLGWALLLTLKVVWGPANARRQRAGTLLGCGLALSAAAWFLWSVSGHLSHGASGSDPHCYLRMALDLAETGSLRHSFSLTAIGRAAEVPLWPLVPVGYHPPDGQSLAVTVWPSGWPALLAPLVWLGGERLALWGAPLMALLAAVLTMLTARALWPRDGWLIGGVAALLLLTAPEGIARTLVPMADAAAQACTALYLLALVLTLRRDRLGWSAIAGAALAVGFWVRHPLICMAPAAPLILSQPSWTWRRRGAHLLALIAGAMPFLATDLAYRWTAFGSPWSSESGEWALLALGNVLPTLRAMLLDGFSRRDALGYLWGVIGLGLVALLCRKDERRWALLMLLGLMPALLFQLSYSALRWRDLISLFPYWALLAGYGAMALWRWADQSNRRRAAALTAILLLLCARTVPTVRLPLRDDVTSFGRVTQAERAAYGQLADDLPADAVIGAGLDAGALSLYTSHETIRPAVWTAQEFDRFRAALLVADRPLILLVGDAEMADLVARLGSQVRPGPLYDLPRFGPGGEPQQGFVRSYWFVE